MFCKRCGSALPSHGYICKRCGAMMDKEQIESQKAFNKENKDNSINLYTDSFNPNIKRNYQKFTENKYLGAIIIVIILLILIVVAILKVI